MGRRAHVCASLVALVTGLACKGKMTGGTERVGDPLCSAVIAPGPAPMRRLTRFEYDNTVRDLLGDETQPARAFPPEELGNGFGNDASRLSVSRLLAEQYSLAAK